jgi:hypothetical protein
MSSLTERKRILITVKTYPHPSLTYDELVCVAGITDDGQWIRLYPVDYLNLPGEARFKKYQWIEVDVEPWGVNNDQRVESRRPRLQTLEVVPGPSVSRSYRWRARREIIDPMPHHTLNELTRLYNDGHISLGIVRPTKVHDLETIPTTPKWEPKYEQIYQQGRLFDKRVRPLSKIPFSFRYVFECEDSQNRHTAALTDWEAGILFLKECERLGDEHLAAKSVRKKFLEEICGPGRDTRFFMGTYHPYNTWLVLGTFWPPKEMERQRREDEQGHLF